MHYIFIIFCFSIGMLLANQKVLMLLAHLLNNLLDLPHPGPEDPQGACWCRRHEGKNKYSFTDYLKLVVLKK
jgi:hypothetical protein